MDVDSNVTIPHSITDNMPENKTVFTISGIISLISCLISIFGFNQISIAYKIIICLSIVCLVLLFNVIFLYVKEREHYYQACYNIAISNAVLKQSEKLRSENEELKSKIMYV